MNVWEIEGWTVNKNYFLDWWQLNSLYLKCHILCHVDTERHRRRYFNYELEMILLSNYIFNSNIFCILLNIFAYVINHNASMHGLEEKDTDRETNHKSNAWNTLMCCDIEKTFCFSKTITAVNKTYLLYFFKQSV